MSTKDQTILYTLFELPALKDSRLILIGLANALDLTDRALVRLQSRVQFKPLLLNFPPYSKQEIAAILSKRIQEAVSDDVGSVIAPSALQYLGGCRTRRRDSQETTRPRSHGRSQQQQQMRQHSSPLQNDGQCREQPFLCQRRYRRDSPAAEAHHFHLVGTGQARRIQTGDTRQTAPVFLLQSVR